MTPLSSAIEAAAAYAAAENETVHMVSARSLDFANRWFRVEGTRKAYRRVYIVDMDNRRVTEMLGGSQASDEDLILRVQRQNGEAA